MNKRNTKILIIFVIVALFPLPAVAHFVTVEFLEKKNIETNKMAYSMIFKRGEQIIAKRTFGNSTKIINEGEIPDGMVVENYPSGKVKNIMFFEKGKRNGPAISLYESGRIKGQVYYENGNTTGKGFYYFESGAIKTEFEIVNGKELYHYEYTESGKKGRYRTEDGKDVVE